MPKIFGTNLLGILAATVAFFMLGWLWFGILFQAQWLEGVGLTLEGATAIAEKSGAMMYVWGIVISLVQAIGLAFVLHHASASKLMTCAKISGIVGLLIAVPIAGYGTLYEGNPLIGLIVNGSYSVIGYAIMGAVISLFKGKDAIGE